MDSDVGPSDAPPSLPVGWIAQWDANSRKYYYVQISTGESVWDIPTQEAPLVPTPGTTPAQSQGPYAKPGERGMGSEEGGGDRGLGTMAMNALLNGGNKQNQQHSSGLGGLAQQFLGGGGHQGSSGQSHGSSGGGLLGSLAGSFLGGSGSGKPPSGHQSGTQHSAHGGISGFMSNLGGGSHHQQGGFGYSSNGNTGVYNEPAPPSSYQPGRPAHGGSSTSSHQQQSSYGAGPGSNAEFQTSSGPPPPYPDPQSAGGYSQHGQGGHHSQGGAYDSQQVYGQPPSGYGQGQSPSGYGQGPPPTQQYQAYGGGSQYPGANSQSQYPGQQQYGGLPPYPGPSY